MTLEEKLIEKVLNEHNYKVSQQELVLLNDYEKLLNADIKALKERISSLRKERKALCDHIIVLEGESRDALINLINKNKIALGKLSGKIDDLREEIKGK